MVDRTTENDTDDKVLGKPILKAKNFVLFKLQDAGTYMSLNKVLNRSLLVLSNEGQVYEERLYNVPGFSVQPQRETDSNYIAEELGSVGASILRAHSRPRTEEDISFDQDEENYARARLRIPSNILAYAHWLRLLHMITERMADSDVSEDKKQRSRAIAEQACIDDAALEWDYEIDDDDEQEEAGH